MPGKPITSETDNRLNRPDAIRVKWKGETISLPLLLFRLGKHHLRERIGHRLENGWSIEEAIRRPWRKHRVKKPRKPDKGNPETLAAWRRENRDRILKYSKDANARFSGEPGSAKREAFNARHCKLNRQYRGEPGSPERAQYNQKRRMREKARKNRNILEERNLQREQDQRFRESLHRFLGKREAA